MVLTPGPLNETAYEHAALATTLGYPLVQGRDLTVRGDRVWMRSVGQFEPVDVILRRVDGFFCDPLELRPDSKLGVPGLLEVARAGQRIDRQLGPARPVLENPALMAFLPRLGLHLLGREPSLRSAATWWCGEPAACAYVLEHLAELVLRPVSRGRGPQRGARLGAVVGHPDLAGGPDPGAAGGVGGSGGAGHVLGSGADRRGPGVPPLGPAHLRHRPARFLHGDARRVDPGGA